MAIEKKIEDYIKAINLPILNKQIITEKSIKKIEKRFDEKIVTFVWRFKKFYKAEEYHQDYYQKNFINYLAYKSACQREEVLKKIWN